MVYNPLKCPNNPIEQPTDRTDQWFSDKKQLHNALEKHKTHELYNWALQLLREKYTDIPNALNRNEVVDISFNKRLDIIQIAKKKFEEAKELYENTDKSSQWFEEAKSKFEDARWILNKCLLNIREADQKVDEAKELYDIAEKSGKWVVKAKRRLDDANRILKESKFIDLSDHIYIRYDKMIVQRTREDWKEYTMTIDTKYEEPIRSKHYNNSFDNAIHPKRYTFNGKRTDRKIEDDNKFYDIIRKYIDMDCEVETRNEIFTNYTPHHSNESVDDYNWYVQFDWYLNDLCDDFNIDKDNLRNKTITVTYQNYKLMISKKEISVECPWENNSVLRFLMNKDAVYWSEVFNNNVEDAWKAISLRNLNSILKIIDKKNRVNSIEFDWKNFEEIIELLKSNKSKCEIK